MLKSKLPELVQEKNPVDRVGDSADQVALEGALVPS